MRVLVACEFSGVVRRAFKERGHDAYSCDLIDSDDNSTFHIKCDCREILACSWDLMIAHPPCTYLASSGARWFKDPERQVAQREAVSFFIQVASAPIKWIALENPVGVISTILRKPDQIVQPWQFGHPETKATCLWLKGLPLLVPTNVVEPDYMRKLDGTLWLDRKGKRCSRIHWMSGRKDPETRRKLRSRTYEGIAAAMASQWG